MTTVVNLFKEQYDQYIGKAGKGQDGYFGNPFPLKAGESRGATIERYKEYFNNRIATDNVFKQRVLALKDKKLGCFCKPNACHGDVIADYVNNYYKESSISALEILEENNINPSDLESDLN